MLLGVLVGIVNLTSQKEIIKRIDVEKFMKSLQMILIHEEIPYSSKSLALLAISNIFSIDKQSSL